MINISLASLLSHTQPQLMLISLQLRHDLDPEDKHSVETDKEGSGDSIDESLFITVEVVSEHRQNELVPELTH